MTSWIDTPNEFQQFIQSFGDKIETHIWPSYTASGWVGNSASWAAQSSLDENEICIEIIQRAGILRRTPTTPHYTGTNELKDHLWHYQVEDYIETRSQAASEFEQAASVFPMANLAFYVDSVDPSEMKSHFMRQFVRKYQGTFQLKMRFQRPRPQQMAYIGGQADFEWYQARSHTHTGNHPSLISGHCAQGLLIVAGILEERLAEGSVSEEELEALSQFAVDFGDRRVFAGVHYPTDNISSWALSLSLTDKIFGDPDYFRDFLVNAITKRSLVYKIIESEFPKYSSLHPALAFLEEAINS